MATGSYASSFSRVAMDSGTGNSVTILRNCVSTRGTRLGVSGYSLAILESYPAPLTYQIPIHDSEYTVAQSNPATGRLRERVSLSEPAYYVIRERVQGRNPAGRAAL